MFRLVYRGVAILCAVMMVSGCGGGGGGGGNVAMEPMAPPMEEPIIPVPSEMQTAFTGTQNRDTSVLSRASSRIADAILQGQEDPIFGSVAQGFASSDISRVQGIDTTFNGRRYTLSINRQDGSSTTVDTSRDNVFDVVERSPSENPVTNRNWVDGYIVNESESEYTGAGVVVDWSSSDFTDYVSGGYWVHVDFSKQHGGEIGAFIDGPEFENPIEMPLTGTATYDGRAGGLYIGVNGGDFPTSPAGTYEQGEYDGRVTLVANFGTNRIGGKIDNIDVYNIMSIEPNGSASYSPYSISTDYELLLPFAPMNRAGEFIGDSVILTHPQIPIRSSIGSWAGKFSSIDDRAGHPRSVAGTNALHATTFGGSSVVITGAFYGATEQFE